MAEYPLTANSKAPGFPGAFLQSIAQRERCSAPSVLLLVFFPAQLKLPFSLFFLSTANLLKALSFSLLSLKIQGLLSLCSRPGCFHLPAEYSAHSFGIYPLLCFSTRLQRRAEPKLTPVFQQKGVYFILFGFCTKNDSADLIPTFRFSLVKPDPKWLLKQNGQF